MASSSDLTTALWVNALLSAVFLICYALLKNQPLNSRVYFPRWYVNGQDERVSDFVDVGEEKGRIARYVNLNWRSYVHTMDWVWSSLRMTQAELVELVGLDSVVYLRIFLLGLKIFLPMLLWGCAVLIPVNKTDGYLATLQADQQSLTSWNYSEPDTLSIANVGDHSKRLWAHLFASYLFTGWTCLMLYIEYATVEKLRLDFLASKKQRPDQFTVLVRQVPKDKNQSVGLRIQEFFKEIHSEHYVTHQVVYNANKLTKLMKKKEKYEGKLERWHDNLCDTPSNPRPTVRKKWYQIKGEKLDAIDFYEDEVDRLENEIKSERKKILSNKKFVMRAGFVSFDSRWGAAVCAQTQQCRDHTKWLTEWAPEPRDVYWDNLSLPYMMLNARRLIVTIIVFAIIFFYLIPVGIVQSLANLDYLTNYLPFLKHITRLKLLISFIQGFLPSLVLKIFLLLVPFVLKLLTKFEGHVSYSKIDKYAAFKYHLFLVVNVFFGNVLIGSLFQQLKQYLSAPTTIPKAFGISVPEKATFFMTYIMLDGWTSIAAEILRLWPLLWFHIRNTCAVKTDKERVKVIPAQPAQYFIALPRLCLYILLGLVYSVISPLILPFLCIYFAFGYLIYRNQVINVYETKYESAASFWPFIHRNIITALIIEHVTLMGLFAVKKAFASYPFLIPLPIVTFLFHLFCSQKFYPAFQNYPLQEAKLKDKMEPEVDVKNFLETAYLHPSIKSAPADSKSDDDPDTIKNGTAPRSDEDDSSHRILNVDLDPAPSSDSAIKELYDSNLQSSSSTSRHIRRDSSGSTGSHRRSNGVHVKSFNSLPSAARGEIAHESANRIPNGRSNGPVVNVRDTNKPFAESLEPHASKDAEPTAPKAESGVTADRNYENRRKDQRNDEIPQPGKEVPSGHLEP